MSDDIDRHSRSDDNATNDQKIINVNSLNEHMCIVNRFYFCKNIADIVIDYMNEYILIDWIEADIEKLDYVMLCKNPLAIDLIEKLIESEPNKINWTNLSMNPNPRIVNILRVHKLKAVWFHLSANPGAIELLKENPDRIIWSNLSENPAAIPLLEKNLNKIRIFNLLLNPNAGHLIEQFMKQNRYDELMELKDRFSIYLSKNPSAVHILEKNRHLINLYFLGSNYNAMDLIEEYKDKMVLNCLCSNTNSLIMPLIESKLKKKSSCDWDALSANPAAIELLEKYRDRIKWPRLSENPNAMHLLENNKQNVNWRGMSKNPSIFKLRFNKDFATYVELFAM